MSKLNPRELKESFLSESVIGGLAVAGGVAALAIFCGMRYKVSPPEKYLVRTGLGIKNLAISKTGVVWPFQRCMLKKTHKYHVKRQDE
jgi:uncharacterized membrane protein YqiK